MMYPDDYMAVLQAGREHTDLQMKTQTDGVVQSLRSTLVQKQNTAAQYKKLYSSRQNSEPNEREKACGRWIAKTTNRQQTINADKSKQLRRAPSLRSAPEAQRLRSPMPEFDRPLAELASTGSTSLQR